MRNVFTIVLLFVFVNIKAQIKSFDYLYVDYSIGNFDDSLTLWQIRTVDIPSDTTDINYAAVGIIGPMQGFTDITNIPSSIIDWSYYFNPIGIDSLFAYVAHKNHSSTIDTIVMQLIKLDASTNLSPTDIVLWSDTLFTTQSLTNSLNDITRIAFSPMYITNLGQKVGITIKYYGSLADTLMLQAGARKENGGIAASPYKNSWLTLKPTIPGKYCNANVLLPNGTPFPAQNWKLQAYIDNGIPSPIAVLENKVDRIKIYPNPASDLLQIIVDKNQPVSMQLINSLGQIIWQQNTGNQSSFILDVSNFSAGIYYLNTYSSVGFKSYKVAVK